VSLGSFGGGREVKPSFLDLAHKLPVKDLRKLLYQRLSPLDRFMIQAAHNLLETANVPEYEIRGLCLAAVRLGYLDILKWFAGIWPHVRHMVDLADAAAMAGNLHVFQLFELGRRQGVTWTSAAGAGHVHILEWGLQQGYHMPGSAYNRAAYCGQLHVLKWLLKAKGLPGIFDTDVDVCGYAAWNGQLEALQWAVDNGFPFSRAMCTEMAKDQPATLEWIRSRRIRIN